MRLIMPMIAVVFAAGCATPIETEPPPSIEPANFTIAGSVNWDVPPKLAEETGLPPTIKATLNVEANAEAISQKPLRSHHVGHLALKITDGTGTQPLADVNLEITGEADGSPTQGLGKVITYFLDAGNLMANQIPSAMEPKMGTSGD